MELTYQSIIFKLWFIVHAVVTRDFLIPIQYILTSILGLLDTHCTKLCFDANLVLRTHAGLNYAGLELEI
jgi:hypothetical protein